MIDVIVCTTETGETGINVRKVRGNIPTIIDDLLSIIGSVVQAVAEQLPEGVQENMSNTIMKTLIEELETMDINKEIRNAEDEEIPTREDIEERLVKDNLEKNMEKASKEISDSLLKEGVNDIPNEKLMEALDVLKDLVNKRSKE